MKRSRSASATIDVRLDSCPITWVKTRIALERVGQGELVVVLLREGDPLRNVPVSAEEEGHRVISMEPIEDEGSGAWELVLEKGAARPALDLP